MTELPIVIIGNGISGVTCAREIRKRSKVPITIISSESKYFFSRTALMYVYMGHMRYEDIKPYEDFFWEKNRLTLIHDLVTSVDFEKKTIHLNDLSTLLYSELVLACGSIPNKLTVPGTELAGIQSLYSMGDLDLMEKSTRGVSSAVIVGGGLIGIEMAEMLVSRKVKVTFLVRERLFWNSVLPEEESVLVEGHIRSHGVNLLLDTQLLSISGTNRVEFVTTNRGEIACQFVGVTIGVRPNIHFLEDTALDTDRGILVDEYLATNIPHVYAIGDCAQYRVQVHNRKNIEQVWYTGRIHGQALARTLTGNKTAYRPGNWFNSAKFFDIEYQHYGVLPSQLPAGEDDFHWQHPSKHILFRARYVTSTRGLVGIDVLGIRLRHETIDNWLTQRITIDKVIKQLSEAIFDAEFSPVYVKEISNAFNIHNKPVLSQLNTN